jgi:uncharacterized RDD family membrane protein YckC
MSAEDSGLEYVGFWARVGASLVDSVLVLIVLVPVLRLVFGSASDLTGIDLSGASLTGSALGALGNAGAGEPPLARAEHFLLEWLLPAAAVVAFWIARQATPGKMLISARIVDAHTGGRPGAGQAIARYLGYFVSTIPLGLGLIWVGLDPRKQGWHDKIAGTVVVRPRRPRAPSR